jgi:hypothetical protein
MKNKIALTVALALGSSGVSAEWVRVAENNRFVAYADSRVQRQPGKSLVVWVLFDYKTVQESARTGRRYLSEKAQREIDCAGARGRVLFFTWHADKMGDGPVVYTGGKPTEWEPSSAPQSIGNALWKHYCRSDS